MIYKVVVSDIAKEQIRRIGDRRIQDMILKKAEGLATDPEKQGKQLWDDLAGYRSVRAVGQRYRIVYRVEQSQVEVAVIAAGIRKSGDKNDVYRLAKKLVKLGLA